MVHVFISVSEDSLSMLRVADYSLLLAATSITLKNKTKTAVLKYNLHT